MKRLSVLTTCLVAWLLVGCALTTGDLAVRIRSVSDPVRSAGKNYVLLAGDKDVSSDPHFGELAGYVRRTLAELGYREVGAPSADVIIFLRYGSDTCTIDCNALVRPALYVPDGPTQQLVPVAAYESGSTPLASRLSYASSDTEVTVITPVSAVYYRWFSLEAVDAHASKRLTLWNIAAVASGYYPDLNRVFPILLAASKPFIGRATKKEVVVRLREDDEEVRSIRGDSAR